MMSLEAAKNEKEESKMQRLISRKKANPTANQKNYDQENQRMGVTHEVHLLLDQMDQNAARTQYDKGLIGFSQDQGSIKKAKEARFLTV